MREILFRGKRTDNGKWVTGLLARYNPKYEIANMVTDFDVLVPVYTETVGQYTGLSDMNGNKIFDGDIIKNHFEIGVVKFGSYETPYRDWSAITQDIFSKHIGFYINWITLDYRKDIEFWQNKIKVIGNIHDNPELLKLRTTEEK